MMICKNYRCDDEVFSRGWCKKCYQDWWRRGTDEAGNPLPPKRVNDLEGHMEDFLYLVESGETCDQMLAERVGVSESTVRRYRVLARRQGLL